MKRTLFCLIVVAFVYSPSYSLDQLDAGAAKPPVAKKVPRATTLNGDMFVDDYFWLREKTNKEVIEYLEAENAYTDAVMKPTVEFQAKLYKEILGRIKQTDLDVPYKHDDFYYYG